jgi:hypothetical protein
MGNLCLFEGLLQTPNLVTRLLRKGSAKQRRHSTYRK